MSDDVADKTDPSPEENQQLNLIPYQFIMYDGSSLLVLLIGPKNNIDQKLHEESDSYRVVFPLKLLLPSDDDLFDTANGLNDDDDDEEDFSESISTVYTEMERESDSIPIRIVEWMPLAHPMQIMEIPKSSVHVKAMLDQPGATQYTAARQMYYAIHMKNSEELQKLMDSYSKDDDTDTVEELVDPPVEKKVSKHKFDAPPLIEGPYNKNIGPFGDRWSFLSNN